MIPQPAAKARPATPLPLAEEVLGAAGRVVVGVDGSATSVAALRWAVREAARLEWVVDVVTAWPDRAAVFVRQVPGHHSEHRHRAVAAQREALSTVIASERSVPAIRTFVENARPADALMEHSAGASMIVVGASRRDPAGSLGVDHPSRVDAVRIECPVVVVDEPGRR
jgi:nucleotide-binding universal stress UspA family protein